MNRLFNNQTLDEARHLAGTDDRSRGSNWRNFQFDTGLSEGVLDSDSRKLIDFEILDEEAVVPTDDMVVAELQKRLQPLLPNATMTIFKLNFVAATVIVDVFAAPPGAANLDQLNAKHRVRFAFSSWKNGVPVKMGSGGDATETGGKIVLSQPINRDAPKMSKRTTTISKAIEAVVDWFKDCAELFSPPGGWAQTVRGTYEPNMEGHWQPGLPQLRAADDFESWAAARDDKSDGTPEGVMGETHKPRVSKPSLRDLAEGAPRSRPRARVEHTTPAAGPSKHVVEDLDRLLKSLRG